MIDKNFLHKLTPKKQKQISKTEIDPATLLNIACDKLLSYNFCPYNIIKYNKEGNWTCNEDGSATTCIQCIQTYLKVAAQYDDDYQD